MTVWTDGMNRSEIDEMINDACDAYQLGVISASELNKQLASLGLNATDISDREKEFRPPPPENDNAKSDGDSN